MARTLPADFPGLAALQEAGEATPAKVRKRIDDDTLTEIPHIGPAMAEKIKEAFSAFGEGDASEKGSNPDDPGTPAAKTDAGAKSLAKDIMENEEAARDKEANSPAAGTTIVNEGGTDDTALLAGAAEQQKPGAVKNEELVNHDLADLTPAEKVQAGIRKTAGERLRDCGAVFVDDPAGPYASREAVRITADRGRIKVLPISHVSPQRGMMVKDGEDVYNIQEPIGPDANPDAWLQVRSPNTGKAFIE